MSKNIRCKRCNIIPEFYHEIEIIRATPNMDQYGINKIILCNNCIREVYDAIAILVPALKASDVSA